MRTSRTQLHGNFIRLGLVALAAACMDITKSVSELYRAGFGHGGHGKHKNTPGAFGKNRTTAKPTRVSLRYCKAMHLIQGRQVNIAMERSQSADHNLKFLHPRSLRLA